jgi:hypothetical protein
MTSNNDLTNWKRVSRLEENASPRLQLDSENRSSAVDPSSLIRVRLTSKRYQPQNSDLNQYQDHIWFDCSYLPERLAKPTRAVKGLLEFTDLFGEVKFRIGLTLNDRLEPGRPFSQQGLGLEYNQFLADHQWMLATGEADMRVLFRVTNILYEDGTVEAFA